MSLQCVGGCLLGVFVCFLFRFVFVLFSFVLSLFRQLNEYLIGAGFVCGR
jgi:RsiW-degrading membrane proteinase PrsW (M82 family)